jgi:COP9 signalosome complex subunit 1
MGLNDLADHYYETGDLQNALKYYTKSREYCTTSSHIMEMYQNVIKVCDEKI